MDGLELVMDHGHLHEGIEVERVLAVDEALEVRHQRRDLFVALGRRKDHFPGLVVLQGGAGEAAKTRLIALQGRLHGQDVVEGDQPRRADRFEAFPHGARVGVDLLRRDAREPVGHVVTAIEVVVGRDDVLDRRAVLRLLQRERVDQDRLVRHKAGRALQLRQGAVCSGQLLEDPLGAVGRG